MDEPSKSEDDAASRVEGIIDKSAVFIKSVAVGCLEGEFCVFVGPKRKGIYLYPKAGIGIWTASRTCHIIPSSPL